MNITQSNKNSNRTIKIIVGTYTDNTDSRGLYIIDYDIESDLSNNSVIIPANNPSYIYYDKDSKILLAVEEMNDMKGRIKTFKIDIVKNTYYFVQEALVEGSAPCHITKDPKENIVYISNYMSGNLVSFNYTNEGSIFKNNFRLQFKESSIHPIRQKKSHIHSSFFSPNNVLYIQDLGGDYIYQVEYKNLSKKNHSFTSFKTSIGSGPRHLCFSKNGFVYVLQELSSTIDIFRLDENELIIDCIQSISLNTEQYETKNLGAHIRLSHDEKYIYASNRGDSNTLNVYKRESDGKLVKIQTISCEGKGPRHFDITPNGQFLFVTNQYSNNIAIFSIDLETGLLTYTNKNICLPSPVCIAIV